ncbi:HAD family hydrolase [Radiobacillus deserti]|uniref:HAD family hydrolase n=1 Tax=Radiobacillus deserti TaxID=2594883 RepID=A0A516KL59_9BACI|nr:HAD family hydrolase [Radiobacillus deserti]QDP42125.1 HAD family hydrolase [Radiobacillus deserti]
MEIKAILFDLDGTLLDRDASVQKFIDAQFDRYQLGLYPLSKRKFTQRFLELEERGYVWKDKVYQQIVAESNLSKVTWEELLKDYVKQFHRSCVPFPNLHQTLEKLTHQGLKLGMITNGKDPFQWNNIRFLKIETYFDTILISEREKIKKPNPLIFQRALNQMEVQPSEAYYVGDHPKNDIDGARNVGMKTIWMKTANVEVPKADLVIEDLIEITRVFH